MVHAGPDLGNGGMAVRWSSLSPKSSISQKLWWEEQTSMFAQEKLTLDRKEGFAFVADRVRIGPDLLE